MLSTGRRELVKPAITARYGTFSAHVISTEEFKGFYQDGLYPSMLMDAIDAGETGLVLCQRDSCNCLPGSVRTQSDEYTTPTAPTKKRRRKKNWESSHEVTSGCGRRMTADIDRVRVFGVSIACFPLP
jgi:hypothetical protein